MANTTQDSLFEVFAEVAKNQAPDVSALAGASDRLASTVSQAVQASGGGAGPAPRAATSNSAADNSPSGVSKALSIATTVLESGLGVIPLVTGLLGLFGGGESEAPPPLVKYALPSKLHFEGADSGSGMSGVDYDQMGMPRPFDGSGSVAPRGGGATAPQISVNVQAMDARSFLDHSDEIAQAVRSAMLNLSSINDVVSNL